MQLIMNGSCEKAKRTYTKAGFDGGVSARESENRALSYEAACEGMVLLKNDGALPLKTRRVALYGSGAVHTAKGGTGSGEVNERHSINILEGMESRGFEVTTGKWLDDYEKGLIAAETEHKIEKRRRVNIFKLDTIMQMLFDDFRMPSGREITEEDVSRSDTDTCIYVLSRQAGEGGDRRAEKGDYLLTDEEIGHIRFCAEHYEKFVLAINCGSSIDMSALEQISGINAILYICQLGSEGGNAFADVVRGTVSPSGKLTDSWAKRYGDIPFADEYSHRNGNLQDEYYREGIYVGYRYFDSFGKDVAYPFGFGLGYSTFSLRCTGVSAQGTEICVRAEVKNTGGYAGKEVVQLYVSCPEGELRREYQSLAAFEKTDLLAPGDTQQLELHFDLKDAAAYRERDASFVLEKGSYMLRLGNSSRNTETVGVIELDGEAIVSRHEHICPVRDAIDEIEAPTHPEDKFPADIARIAVSTAAVETVDYSYGAPDMQDADAQRFVSGLTAREMTEIVVGIGMFGGKKRFELPGAVGNTTSAFWERGLANVALCDGPAGLRVQKRSTVDKRGKIRPVDMPMSVFDAFPKFIKRIMTGNTKKNTMLYQYATAFPVANALCQSWNKALMRRVGAGIYREMKEYGCTFWLAPAVNIHRNPLCGRNFEYFSEDPLLTGDMASEIILGVQQEDGYYVTVKHFACNNQEDNRNYVSSNLSERALREIYLRAFERTVCRGGARGIMSSYNRVNGIYAANSADLLTKVLRNEWGFSGVVMTDWFSTARGKADSALCMRAGNDLIMPGGRRYKREIMRGIKKGAISEEELRHCCANVVSAILHSDIQREYIRK